MFDEGLPLLVISQRSGMDRDGADGILGPAMRAREGREGLALGPQAQALIPLFLGRHPDVSHGCLGRRRLPLGRLLARLDPAQDPGIPRGHELRRLVGNVFSIFGVLIGYVLAKIPAAGSSSKSQSQ